MIGLGTLINSAGIIAGGAYCNSCGISAMVLIQRIFFTRRQKNDSPPHHAATGRSLNNINRY